jgi:acetoin utilization deacetylase AcuC-like enzyme
MKIFYSPSYTIATHSFETTRKSGWIAESLAREPIAGILVAPEPASAAALSRVHDPEYVDAVRKSPNLQVITRDVPRNKMLFLCAM